MITLQRFFEEARAGRLTGIRCRRCGELAVPPKEFCPACHERDWEPAPLTGHGTITSFTVIRVPPRGRAPEAPYVVALVSLAEGISLFGRIVHIPIESVEIGLPVKFHPLLTEDQTMVAFGPA